MSANAKLRHRISRITPRQNRRRPSPSLRCLRLRLIQSQPTLALGATAPRFAPRALRHSTEGRKATRGALIGTGTAPLASDRQRRGLRAGRSAGFPPSHPAYAPPE